MSTAAFSTDGDRIVTASKDGTARVWWRHRAELLRLADERLSRTLRPVTEAALRARYVDLLGD